MTDNEKELIKFIRDSKDPEAAILKAAVIIAKLVVSSKDD